MDAKILGDRVHMERRTLKINQDELARRASISRTYISEIENCSVPNPSVDVVFALADALKVSAAYLLGLSADPLGEDLPASRRRLSGNAPKDPGRSPWASASIPTWSRG